MSHERRMRYLTLLVRWAVLMFAMAAVVGILSSIAVAMCVMSGEWIGVVGGVVAAVGAAWLFRYNRRVWLVARQERALEARRGAWRWN